MSDYGYGKSNFNKQNNESVHSGPATRKLAREFGIDLNRVSGTGPKNRILKEDLHAYVKNALQNSPNQISPPSRPEIDFSKWGKTRIEKLSKFQKTASENQGFECKTLSYQGFRN